MTATTDGQANADALAAAGGRTVRRFVNEAIVARGDGTDDRDVLELVCECGDLECSEVVRLPFSAFDRDSPAGAIVAHGERRRFE